MPQVNIIANTPEWLAFRKGKLSASKAPIILGLSQYQTPYELYEEEIGLRDPQPSSPHMEAGLAIEDEARDWFFKRMGIEVKPTVWVHPTNPLFIGSLDGISVNYQTILEIKKNGKELHELTRKGFINPAHEAQMQHAMYVVGLDECFYLSYRKDDCILLTLKRNESFIADMIQKELAFKRMCDDLIPPPLTERDYEDMSYNVHLNNYAQQYDSYGKSIRELELMRSEAKNEIREIIGIKNVRCHRFKITRYPIEGRVDYERLIAENCPDVDLDNYRKEKSYGYRITTED